MSETRRVVSLQSDESGLWLVLSDGSAWYGKHWPPEWQRIPLPPTDLESGPTMAEMIAGDLIPF